jgi:hypothetical protein
MACTLPEASTNATDGAEVVHSACGVTTGKPSDVAVSESCVLLLGVIVSVTRRTTCDGVSVIARSIGAFGSVAASLEQARSVETAASDKPMGKRRVSRIGTQVEGRPAASHV